MTGDSPKEADALFEQLVTRFSADAEVTLPSAAKGRMFGASALKVDNRIFAMLTKGELVVKLPRHRVAELVASGTGRPFSSGQGRVMKEWVTIALAHGGSWDELADEARQFAGSQASVRPRRA